MKKIFMYSGLFLLLMVLGAFGLSYATPHFRSMVSHVTGIFTIISLAAPLGVILLNWPVKKEMEGVVGCILIGTVLLETMYVMWETTDYGILKHVIDIAWTFLNIGSIFRGNNCFNYKDRFY